VPAISLANMAYDKLRQALDNFHYVPGDRFSESEVGTELGMSRTPVREALVRLQREGCISVIPKLGWVVNSIDFTVFEQLYDVRAVLECAAVDLLVGAGQPALLRPLGGRARSGRTPYLRNATRSLAARNSPSAGCAPALQCR